MKTSNIFANIPLDLQEELFEDIISNKNIKIERIISDGHTSPKTGWYESEKNEWIIVLQGEAILEFQIRQDIKLRSGDYVNIPAHRKHKVSYTSKNEKTIWLVIYY